MARLGVYLGTTDDDTAHVARVVRAWGEHLSLNHELEAFGTALVPTDAKQFYRYVETERRTSLTPFDKIWSSYKDCREYIARRKPDAVLQVWQYKTHAPGASLAGAATGTPIVTRYNADTFAEYRDVAWPKKPAIFALDHIAGRVPLRLADATVVLGPYGRQQMIQRGVAPDQTAIVPPPTDSSARFTPPADKGSVRRSLGLPEDGEIALFVGRLSVLKGMPFLHDVMQLVHRERDITFVLVGDGPYREKFAESFDGKVRLPGRVPHEEVHAYYQAADVYVHPSRFEGIPLVILEALETGTPVVARDAGDVSFVIDTTVETPAEMVSFLRDGPWETTWLHRELFESSHQRRELLDIVAEVVDS